MIVPELVLVVPCRNEVSSSSAGVPRVRRAPSVRQARLRRRRKQGRDAPRPRAHPEGARPRARAYPASAAQRGKAEAVRAGVVDALERAPEAVGFWDADLATPLSELPAFVEAPRQHPQVEVILGSRVKLMGRSIERRRGATTSAACSRRPRRWRSSCPSTTRSAARRCSERRRRARVFDEPFGATGSSTSRSWPVTSRSRSTTRGHRGHRGSTS